VDEVSTAKNNSVVVTKGINGLDKIILRQIHGSAVELYLYGAHVTSWKNDHGEELLLLSSKAIFSPPTAIRGGIPIIFPQFSNLGPLRSHGFARNRVWTIDTNPPPFPPKTINGVFVDLLLKPTQDDLNIWPNSFEFRLRVTLGIKGDLTMTSRIKNTNTDNKPFNFTFAYHNYFRVSDISEVRVERLKSLDYLDNLQNRTRFTEEQDAVTFNAEVDRIYLSTPTKIPILDNKKKQRISVHKNGLPDAVVWNPWNKSIVDLGVDDYKSMVAVEVSAIGKPVVLKAGEEWKASQRLSVVTSR
jgi:glucose-6-phosphate 1-epimerase